MLVIAALATPSCIGKQFSPFLECTALALLLLVAFLLLGFHAENFEPQQHVECKRLIDTARFWGKHVEEGFSPLCCSEQKASVVELTGSFFV